MGPQRGGLRAVPPALARGQGHLVRAAFRPPLIDAEVWPRPLQQPIRVWHGSATSRESVDLAARYGDPLFSANVTNPIEPYAELVRHYRERWAHYGHDPADAVVGAGTAGLLRRAAPRRRRSTTYRPIFEGRLRVPARLGVQPVFATLEDFVERSSALIGSPQQIVDKVHRYHDQFGHEVLHLHADARRADRRQHRESAGAVPGRDRAGAAPGHPRPALGLAPGDRAPPAA